MLHLIIAPGGTAGAEWGAELRRTRGGGQEEPRLHPQIGLVAVLMVAVLLGLKLDTRANLILTSEYRF